MAFRIETAAGPLVWEGDGLAETSSREVVDVVLELAAGEVAVTPTGPFLTAASDPEAWTYLQALWALDTAGIAVTATDPPVLPMVEVPEGALA